MIGEKLDDRYELLEELGANAISLLFKARDLGEDRIVAVKMLKEEYTSDKEIVTKFINCAAALHEIVNIKNIAAVYTAGQKGGRVFAVREFVEGISLREKLQQAGGRLSLEEVKYLGVQICEALYAASLKDVTHAGLHPNNILITADDQVKVTDFGISLIALLPSLGENDFPANSLDPLRYAAPEQFHSPKVEDQRTDIYQLGLILQEMFFGAAPFTAESFQEYRDGHTGGDIPAQPQVINLALQKDPKDRYQDARALENDLGNVSELPPILQVSPLKLDLADIPKGRKKSATLTISNGGGGELQGKVEVGPDYARHFHLENQEFALTAAKPEEEGGPGLFLKKVEVRVEVDTAHLDPGTHKIPLKVTSNGGDQIIPLTWRVRGEKGEELIFTPESLEYGTLRWRGRKELGLEIRNGYSQDLDGHIKVSHPENILIAGLDKDAEGNYRLALTGHSRLRLKVIFTKQGLAPGEFHGSLECQCLSEVKTIPLVATVMPAPQFRIQVPRPSPKVLKWSAVLVISLLVLFGGYQILAPVFTVRQFMAEVDTLLQAGEYQGALERIEHSPFHDKRLEEIKDRLKQPLTLKLEAWYIDGGETKKRVSSPIETPRIPSGGSYRFVLEMGAESYLYIYQLDSHSHIEQLFPNPKYSQTANPLPAGLSYLLPDMRPGGGEPGGPEKNRWFFLDDNVGVEKIYFVASPWPALDLERLSQQFQQAAPEEEKKSFRDQLISRLESRRQAQVGGLQGTLYQEFCILHGPSTVQAPPQPVPMR